MVDAVLAAQAGMASEYVEHRASMCAHSPSTRPLSTPFPVSSATRV